jgi:uncharacterized protein (DUF58 family)
MIPKEILKKVKLIEIQTKKMVNNIFAGEYHTHFKGQGMTFSDFREYVAGDDVRSISWPLTARTGKTFVKTYEEERELSVILAVDVSGSTDFGSGKYVKGEVIVYLSALLAFAAEKNKDQVGLILFSDRVEHFVPPKKGRGHLQRLLRDLLYFKPVSRKTNLGSCASFLQGYLKKRATIFFMSDFFDQAYEQNLRLLAKKHEVIACVINDPVEENFPDLGLIEFEDSETGERVLLDTASMFSKEKVKRNFYNQNETRDRMLKKSQVDKIVISTQGDFVQPLIAYFRRKK